MGKRSTSTTKSGKFMNPTDQARKEARRRELKKNKKQRLLVRQAVLKGKDIATIFTELEKVDQMEFNAVQAAPLSEKVLKEKRKKLRDTLNRVMRLYEKEDPTQWTQIKALEVQYEKRRAELIIYSESVKHAQSVVLDEIPLPNLSVDSASDPSSSAHVSLSAAPHHGILKKLSAYGRRPPGVPSVPPPELRDIWDEGDADDAGPCSGDVEPGVPGIDDQDEAGMDALPPYHTYYQFIRPPVAAPAFPAASAEEEEDDDDDDDEDDEDDDDDEEDDDGGDDDGEEVAPPPAKMPTIESTPAPKPTSLQQRMLAIAGQDVNTFMKEMEVAHRQREVNRQVNLENRLARLERGERPDETPKEAPLVSIPLAVAPAPAPPMAFAPAMGFQQHRPPMGFHPPPPAWGAPTGYGPPPSRLPPGPPPRMPQAIPPAGSRMLRPPGMPPPPPPAMRMGGRPPMGGPSAGPSASAASAAPVGGAGGSKPTTVIEAKPQMRNLSADLTRFVPTTLKLKKDGQTPTAAAAPLLVKKAPAAAEKTTSAPRIEWRVPQPVSMPSSSSSSTASVPASTPPQATTQAAPTKDDAYSQFMKDMHQLIN